MTSKEGKNDLEVIACKVDKSGKTTASVEWVQTPELVYRLTLAPAGRLVEFTVSGKGGAAVTSAGVRNAPLGRLQAAVRAAVRSEAMGRREDLWWSISVHRHPSTVAGDDESTLAFQLEEERRMGDELARYMAAAESLDREGPTERIVATAAMYVDLLRSGELRPYDRLTEALGISKKVAQNRLYQAREKGFLTSEGQGKSGGQLTKRAVEVLNKMKERG